MMKRMLLFATVLSSLFAMHGGRGVSIYAQQRPPPPSQAGKTPAGGQDFTNYRGQRKPKEGGDFYIVEIHSTANGDSGASIDVFFSTGIDPRSVKVENIRVDGMTLSSDTKIVFNKEGTQMRLLILFVEREPFSFSMTGAQSYSGGTMEAMPPPSLQKTDRQKYDKERQQWKRF